MKGQLEVATPKQYIASLEEPRRSDVAALDKLIRKAAPKLTPVIQSGAMAYGPFHYKYASGREGEACRLGIASNAQYISFYVLAHDGKTHVAEKYKKGIGKADVGKCCIRFKRLSDLDLKVLEKIIKETATYAGKNYEPLRRTPTARPPRASSR